MSTPDTRPVLPREPMELAIIVGYAYLALGEAKNFNKRYKVYDALGINSRNDKEYTDGVVAIRDARLKIRDHKYRLPNSEYIVSLLEKYINYLQGDYPNFSNRPSHIQNGVSSIMSQADSAPISRWGVRATRRSFRESATTWREHIQREESERKRRKGSRTV